MRPPCPRLPACSQVFAFLRASHVVTSFWHQGSMLSVVKMQVFVHLLPHSELSVRDIRTSFVSAQESLQPLHHSRCAAVRMCLAFAEVGPILIFLPDCGPRFILESVDIPAIATRATIGNVATVSCSRSLCVLFASSSSPLWSWHKRSFRHSAW